MHYYIDGYNLMFRISRNHDDLAVQRQLLIEDLAAKAQFLGLNMTIIFDAQYQSGESTRLHVQTLEIIFTDAGQIADERILDEVRAERHNSRVTVVTSDKKLAWFARRCSALTETVEHFLSWLNKRCKNRLVQKKTVPKIEPKAIPKKKQPAKADSPEQCSAYYEEVFAARFNQIQELHLQQRQSQQASQAKSGAKKKKAAALKKSEESNLSDSERWLQIFQARLEK